MTMTEQLDLQSAKDALSENDIVWKILDQATLCIPDNHHTTITRNTGKIVGFVCDVYYPLFIKNFGWSKENLENGIVPGDTHGHELNKRLELISAGLTQRIDDNGDVQPLNIQNALPKRLEYIRKTQRELFGLVKCKFSSVFSCIAIYTVAAHLRAVLC
jgi:hypothetical protein